MKLWLSKGSDVPIQEQLCTQVILGIVSADLAPAERLPSTQELARRFKIHPNTARAAYRQLAQRGWIEWRRGSGFYVRVLDPDRKLDPSLDLDHLISTFLAIARSRGHSLADIQSRIVRWFSVQPPDHVLVIEPDTELREILISEIRDNISLKVSGLTVADCSDHERFVGAFCVALYDHSAELRAALPPQTLCLFLHSQSIPKRLTGERKPSPAEVITVVSRWRDFLHLAHATLAAVGIDPVLLDLRDARRHGWERGLNSDSFIVTDSLLSRRLPSGCHPRVFNVIADESIENLRCALEEEKNTKRT